MSELTNANKRGGEFRRQLLATASALALIGSVYTTETKAADDDADRPTVWIELGGQLERIDSAQTIFAPPFFDAARAAIKTPMIDSQWPPAYGFGGEGKIAYTPENSDWIFSAAIRYGRANGARHIHHQTVARTPSPSGRVFQTSRVFFGDGQTEFHESHYVLDFQAGKDVGLGLFGPGSSSVISAGVRFAQFNSSSNAVLHARPFLHPFPDQAKYSLFNRSFSEYTGIAQTKRDARGVGPSLSWDASLPLVRSGALGMLNFDWGANVAVLFGRQRARVHHQTARYFYKLQFSAYPTSPIIQTAHTTNVGDHDRTRNVTIPNVGGFAGISLKFPNAKVALGYRADFFFGAVDGGIDTAKKSNIGFYGPFATISIGIGG